uniref:RAB3A interacting protein (rabin3) n=2 Tax=Tetraodon nigroviridis TaxID=99883 RepID=H3CFR6_TETNG
SNAEPLEGFHEVNLASPTTPDLQNQAEQRPSARHCTPPTSLYRTHSLGGRTSLCAGQLPTQPVYSTPRPSHNGRGPWAGPRAGSDAAVSDAAFQARRREPAEGTLLPGEDGEECSALSDGLSRLRSPSVMEVREKGYERLKEELAKAQRELLLKDEECERLSKVRDQLGQELEELTASLFQEAHKMVHEANTKQATAEKQLREALGKIDVLQAEVQALKTLVLSSPTSPVGELPSVGGGGVKTPFRKGHSRNKSTSSAILGTQPDPSATQPIVRECREVDNQLFSDFKTWKEEPVLDRSCCFLERVYREDIYPCLTFSKSEVRRDTHTLTENTLYQPLNPIISQTRHTLMSCLHVQSADWRMILCCLVSQITTVCNFFTYIRYIQQGLVKQQDAEQMFWEVMQLRREMSLAKLGYYKDQL